MKCQRVPKAKWEVNIKQDAKVCDSVSQLTPLKRLFQIRWKGKDCQLAVDL